MTTLRSEFQKCDILKWTWVVKTFNEEQKWGEFKLILSPFFTWPIASCHNPSRMFWHGIYKQKDALLSHGQTKRRFKIPINSILKQRKTFKHQKNFCWFDKLHLLPTKPYFWWKFLLMLGRNIAYGKFKVLINRKKCWFWILYLMI